LFFQFVFTVGYFDVTGGKIADLCVKSVKRQTKQRKQQQTHKQTHKQTYNNTYFAIVTLSLPPLFIGSREQFDRCA
jgi:hypothetical protein